MWNIIGQEKAIEFLKKGIETGKLAHAYMFVGPEHIGKMTAALQLAMALNCDSPDWPCLACASCKKIAAGTHADVQVIGIEKKEKKENGKEEEPGEGEESKVIKIKQIEDLQHDASLPPFEGKHKVFIIDPADLLSGDAANRFLKTLEEPEKNVTFILVTTNEKRLLPTVVSRCQRIEFKPATAAEVAEALVKKLGITPERAKLLAALSHGCPGWAIAASGDESVLERRRQILDRMVSLIDADAEARFAYVAGLAADFTKDRKAVYDVLGTWQEYWRDMMLVKTGCADLITSIDRKDEIIRLAGRFSLAKIRSFIRRLESAAEQLKQNVNPRLALEVLMLDIPIEGSSKFQITSIKEVGK